MPGVIKDVTAGACISGQSSPSDFPRSHWDRLSQ